MKFDVIIGNPPYQEEIENNGRQSPIYNYFMDESFKIADCVELITPARFLFNAGQTPKKWNQERLNDEHFKVVFYEPVASTIFPTTDIKGGVAVTLRNANKIYGEIGVFTKYDQLNDIVHKIMPYCENSLMDICVGAVPYKYTEKLRQDYPEFVELAGKSFDLRTNAFDNLHGKVFFEEPQPYGDYVKIYGRYKNERVALFIKQKYIEGPDNFKKYKVMLPKSNGAGILGEMISSPFISEPLSGHTQTFISIGSFESFSEGDACLKYIKTKFSRVLLGVLKVTQDNPKSTWKYVPLQDFTSNSDIDWSKSISEIDQQLYAKYCLSEEEIQFIEENVQPME